MTKQFANSPILQSSDQANAKQNAANGGLALFGYNNSNPSPHNHGHVGTLSTGENVKKGEVANIGAHNGFLDIGPGKGAVFSQQKTLNKVKFFTLSPSVTPKTAPQIIPWIDLGK